MVKRKGEGLSFREFRVFLRWTKYIKYVQLWTQCRKRLALKNCGHSLAESMHCTWIYFIFRVTPLKHQKMELNFCQIIEKVLWYFPIICAWSSPGANDWSDDDVILSQCIDVGLIVTGSFNFISKISSTYRI